MNTVLQQKIFFIQLPRQQLIRCALIVVRKRHPFLLSECLLNRYRSDLLRYSNYDYEDYATMEKKKTHPIVVYGGWRVFTVAINCIIIRKTVWYNAIYHCYTVAVLCDITVILYTLNQCIVADVHKAEEFIISSLLTRVLPYIQERVSIVYCVHGAW